jgi:outer membrane protein TolC
MTFPKMRLWALAMLLPAALTARQAADTTPVVHSLSARQAAELALKQRNEVINARLDVANQQAFNRQVTGAAYPQIKGSINLANNFNIPVTVLPDFISPSVYGVLEREGVKDGNGNDIKWDGVINTFPAQFGVPWQASLNASVQQLLFQPDVFVGLKARSYAVDLYEKQVAVAEDSVKSNVYRNYYSVLIAKKGLLFAKESELRLAKLYSDQVQLQKNGFIEKLDIEKTQVSLNNIRTSVTQLENLVSVTEAVLKFSLALPQYAKLILTDSLSEEMLMKDVLLLETGFTYENRSEVRAVMASQELLSLQVQRYKLNAYPTIAAFWNIGTSAQRQRFNFFDTGDRWFYSSIGGINMSMALFDGGQRRNLVKQASIALEKSRNNLNYLKQSVDLQVVSARTSLTNAIAALSSQRQNKELAEKVYASTKTKYENGLGSSFELLQAETSLQQSLSNYFESLYGAVVARIGYVRALGKL